MIGEIGAVGGSFIPLAMGFSKEYTGTYLWEFVSFAVCALLLLAMLRNMQVRWTRTWAEKGGRARVSPPEMQVSPSATPASAR
jgi:NNP family nitrate/nitrite transporter-like MFS transporter